MPAPAVQKGRLNSAWHDVLLPTVFSPSTNFQPARTMNEAPAEMTPAVQTAVKDVHAIPKVPC